LLYVHSYVAEHIFPTTHLTTFKKKKNHLLFHNNKRGLGPFPTPLLLLSASISKKYAINREKY